jgi:hypothetical protein
MKTVGTTVAVLLSLIAIEPVDVTAQQRIAPFAPPHVAPAAELFQLGPPASDYHAALAGDAGSGGLLFGGFLGAVAGAGIGYLISQGSSQGCDDGICGWVVPTMVGGATGLVIGGWFGYQVAVGPGRKREGS